MKILRENCSKIPWNHDQIDYLISYSILFYAFPFFSTLIAHFLIILSPQSTFPSPPPSSTFPSSLLISFRPLPLLFSIAVNISSQALGTIPRMSSPPLSYRIFKNRWGSSNVLYSTIIHNHKLHCTIPYYTIQHSHYQMLCCAALYCSISHSHTISYVILDCSVIYWQIKRSLLDPNNIHSFNIWEFCFWFSTSWNKQTIEIFVKKNCS